MKCFYWLKLKNLITLVLTPGGEIPSNVGFQIMVNNVYWLSFLQTDI